MTDSDVLNLQESGRFQTTVERALMILSVVYPEMTRQQLAALTIGERDARLLAIRESTFGSALEVFTTCPGCRQELELSLSTRGLRLVTADDCQHADNEFSAEIEEQTVRFRLPDSSDLQAVTACENIDAAQQILLDRCVIDIQGDADRKARMAETPGMSYSPAFVAALAGQIAKRDPQAEVLLNLQCAECKHEWQSLFDIATFFWSELENHAKRLLNEIHILARVYHWREQDILELTPTRRRWYLEMATA